MLEIRKVSAARENSKSGKSPHDLISPLQPVEDENVRI